MCSNNPAQQREAPMIVVPVVTIGTDVGVAFPLIQERRIDHIGGQGPLSGSLPSFRVTTAAPKLAGIRSTVLRSTMPFHDPGKPGTRTWTSSLRFASAGGNDPITSARPPVLTRG